MSRLRVMIVDDHRVVREGLQLALEIEENSEVVGEAGEGREAVEKAQELKPDLILMDVMMPGMNGIDACQEIRELFPETRVVMLTASSDQESVTSSLVAQGATNREVAGQLVISEFTAWNMVSNILGKLGLRSRSELVRWAFEHDVMREESGDA